jgi:type IV pilus assembly protein PilV
MYMRQSGFTLIEVLISVLVLALGVIGAAGMQLTALRTTQQSAFQTIALDLASEMAEKMRANTGQMKQVDNLNTFMKVNYKSDTDDNPSVPDKMCFDAAVNCNAKELAEFDVYEWETRIKAALPSGSAVICRDANPWDASAGALRWSCDGSGAASSASVVIKIGWQGKNPDGSLINDADKKFPPSVAITVEPYIK